MFEKCNSKQILSQEGRLSQVLSGFQFRPEQQKMAVWVERALETQQKIIVEAGTGTGKTFAYVVPALLSDQKIIISTGTKNLQDQLFHRDLPLIHQALKSTKKIALLKGRANYLCLYRLHRTLKEGRLVSRSVVHELETVREWSVLTTSGDIAELNILSEDTLVWVYVTSNSDNCLGAVCPHFKKCFVARARREAEKADILVVNHHLLLADLLLKEEGFGELLPGAQSVIFDEAHQLPQTASQFFGISLSSNQLLALMHDIRRESLTIAKDAKTLRRATDRLEKVIQDCRLALGESVRRISFSSVMHHQKLQEAITQVTEELTALEKQLQVHLSRSLGLESCWRRLIELTTRWKLLTSETAEKLSSDQIHWVETFKKSFSFHLTPMNIAETFMAYMQRYEGAWIFTSATIAVKDDFQYFAESLGLSEAHTLQLMSPFNYEKQSLLYLPPGIPMPSHVNYTAVMVEKIMPILRASRGRAFVLFTSFKALYEAETLLKAQLDYPLLVQGAMPKNELLAQFRATGNAVLLGTSSFWEGVDVRGEALSCVIIDKLPFASPSDPILKARLENLSASGRNPFMEYQLPYAVINLKQGFGRLIRDEVDKGVLVMCDPRVLSKFYGKVFLNSLPKMRHTRLIEDVEEFFA